MEPRWLITIVFYLLELGRAFGELYPCFASERISTSDRRFFAFAPANVRSEPPIECVFVFGGPPGSQLRLGLYDVRTSGPQVYLGQGSGQLCGNDVIRVYDIDHRGLQLRATYCGLLRRGKMMGMSSNMAVVTYTSDNNDPSTTFSLGVDAIEKRGQITQKSTVPCPPSTSASADDGEVATNATVAGDGRNSTATKGQNNNEYRDWNGSGDSESEEENINSQEENYDIISESSMPVVTTSSSTANPTEKVVEVVDEKLDSASSTSMEEEERNFVDDGSELEGELADKVSTVFSNGNGDYDDDSKSYYYYL